MNKLNTISYVCEINTGTNINNEAIGLYSGIFRFATNNQTFPSGYIYEDLTTVSGSFNTNLLSKDGIKTSNQSIDIVAGGDYSYLSSLSIELVNYNSIQNQMLGISGLYLVGSEMKLYTVIDNTFYSSWVGSVSEYSFDENSFNFVGKDKNNSDNTTLSNYIFGYNNTVYVPVEKDLLTINTTFIKNYEPVRAELNWLHNYQTEMGTPTQDYLNQVFNYYNGGHPHARFTIGTNDKKFYLRTNGDITGTVKAGMYVVVSNDDTLHYIDTISVKSHVVTDGTTQTYTEMVIYESTETVIDYTQFMGYQPQGVTDDIRDQTYKFDLDTISFSVYQKGLYFPPIEGGYDVVNGQVDAITKDGESIKLNVKENEDGSLSIVTTTYITTYLPNRMWYWSNTTGMSDELNNGTLKHLENYGTDWEIFGSPDPTFAVMPFVTPNKYHYFLLEMDEEIKDQIPFAMLNGLVDATEDWTLAKNTNLPPYIGTSVMLRSSTIYHSPYINTPQKTMDSMYRTFEVDVYKVYEDKIFGLVPLLDDGCSFTLQNTRYRYDTTGSSTINQNDIKVKSLTSTNYPSYNFPDSKYLSSFNDTLNWVAQWDTIDDTNYPNNKITPIDTPTSLTSSKYVLFRVSAGIDNMTSKDMKWYNGLVNANRIITMNINNFILGAISMGTYKTIELSSTDDITIKTYNDTNDTLPKVLSDLSDTTVSLPSRDSWIVGGQIVDENKFNVITSICKQSFIGGHTDRHGDIKFKDFINDTEIKWEN